MMTNQELIERLAESFSDSVSNTATAEHIVEQVIKALHLTENQLIALAGVECGECQGEGEFVYSKHLQNPPPSVCPTCKGKGRIQTHGVWPVKADSRMVVAGACTMNTSSIDGEPVSAVIYGQPKDVYNAMHEAGEVKCSS
jgi:DnaJ-class molecular chaperone